MIYTEGLVIRTISRCKPADVNIDSASFNLPATIKAFQGKLDRNDFQRELIRTGLIKKSEIASERLDKHGNKPKISTAIAAYNQYLTSCINRRELDLKPIRCFQRVDGLTQKLRDICQESPKQQVMEYIGVEALKPLFRAKLLPVQYGSIPGRGQVLGKRKIERILRIKLKCKIAVVKGDAEKAYPSVTVECSMILLQRDIRKNKPLIWFVGALMANYPGQHLCIGSYLSTWLFNYVMSYVLRYAMSLAQCRRGVRVAYVKAVVCYADDFSLFGFFSQLVKAMRKATRWARENLGINIKPIWQIYHPSTFAEEKEMHLRRAAGGHKRTEGVDMVGYVIRRTYTIIRDRVFRRIRRQVLRAWEDVKVYGFLPWWRACRITAYKGWVKYSDSVKFAIEYNFYPLLKLARKSVSTHGRKEYVKNEQRILLVAASGC